MTEVTTEGFVDESRVKAECRLQAHGMEKAEDPDLVFEEHQV